MLAKISLKSGSKNGGHVLISTDPVFIVGLPRTASKLIMNQINSYSEVCIFHEMHIRRLGRDTTAKIIKKELKKSNNLERLNALSNLVFSTRLKGNFWKLSDHEYIIFRLDPEELKNSLPGVKDAFTLMKTMMEAQRLHYKKLRTGARNPVHFIYLKSLLEKFPNARILFLTRQTKKIIRSWKIKKISPKSHTIKRYLLALFIIGSSHINTLISKIIIWKWKDDPRFFLVSYEKLINNPEAVFKEICAHIRVPFDPRMADISRVYDSAFDPSTRERPPYNIEWVPPKNNNK